MEQNTKTNLTNVDTWIRLLYMILFGMMLAVARMVIWVVAILQFLMVLIVGQANINLLNLGQGVAKWSLQALLYLTFNSDEKPFPFSDWPEIDEAVAPEIIVAAESGDKADDVPTFTAETTEKPAESEVLSADDSAASQTEKPSVKISDAESDKGTDSEADNDSNGGGSDSDKS